MRYSIRFILTLALVCALWACSTTRRIPDGEILYTGVDNVDIARTDSGRISSALATQVKEAVDVAPNNYIKLIGWRYPFPLGLWVYNNWANPAHGIRHWLYEKLVEEPVLVSEVRPQVRTRMIEEILDNNGYFRNTATYQLVQGKNKKKAEIRYNVTPGNPYPIDSIVWLEHSSPLNILVDSLAKNDPYLSLHRPTYAVDSLAAARIRITNQLRNRGYYFFAPDFIEYLADSIAHRGEIVLKMMIASNIPPFAQQQYRTGQVTLHVARNQGGGVPDTFALKNARLVQMTPSLLRHASVDECIAFRPGRLFSVRNMNRTQTNLARLGIFNTINIEAKPDMQDSLAHQLNVDIFCTFDQPLEVSLEANASSKSNSYIGPGLTVGLTNKNLFGGGEQLAVKLTGSYEWQTGSGSSSVFNSYETGINTSLAFPRLLAPSFVPRSRYQLNWTRFQLNGDILNRPHFFKMAQANISVNYDWRVRRYVQNTFTPFKLTYTKLMHTTANFDSIMRENPAVAQSFKSQFIPLMAYAYTYDKSLDRNNNINVQFSLQEAGNIFWAAYRLCGDKGEKTLLGLPFSQFVKGSAQLVWSRRLGHGDHWLVNRVASGAAHAYGNSTQVPYSEQFYVGGANSIRAFTVRSIGPGSYAPPKGQPDEFFDRTGTFKFEANMEYRFPIVGPVHGALFMDTGNVWLLKHDELRPGGTLQARTFFRDLALGTGAGLRLDISMLVLRADLGIGIHAPYNTGRSGYYNMTSFGKSLALHLAIGYPF